MYARPSSNLPTTRHGNLVLVLRVSVYGHSYSSRADGLRLRCLIMRPQTTSRKVVGRQLPNYRKVQAVSQYANSDGSLYRQRWAPSSLAARDVSYKSSVEARGFDFEDLTLEERGLRSSLRDLKNNIMGGSSAAPSTDAEVQRREVEEELLERDRGAGTSLGRLRVTYIRRSLSAADLRRREELVQRGL
ncbi:hypothetical protein DFP72DRAFT_856617 [Ephemerocybe angulata]|uniref:Uncharacterized protein n=1 Tax=Ephemerocybe angulata TaxID=980116 RepID=A0A8H6HDU4_9AGAR|nr:hypothetical protein DFP72DRAFT_856617 [Tulosesus angulatus]